MELNIKIKDDRPYYRTLLRILAFFAPIYFVFYAPLNKDKDDPFIKSLWWFIASGFCFYAIVLVTIIKSK